MMQEGFVRLFALCALLALPFQAAAQDMGDYGQQQASRNSAADAKHRAKVHTELGALYFQEGNSGVALEELGIALRADSDYFSAYSVRGLVYASLKEYAKADEDFRRALRLAPDDPGVNNNYGWYLCQTGKERQSLQYFLNATRNPLYDTPDRAFANAGTCAMKAGDLEAAEAYLRRAMMLARDGGASTRVQIAALYFKKQMLEEARRNLADALGQMESPTAQALWLGVRLERKLGNRAAEGGYAAQLRSRYPGSPEYQDFLNGKFDE